AGFAVDITDRKQLEALEREKQEKALAQSKQALEDASQQRNYFEDTSNILEEIINHIPANIYWMDKNCIYQGCNDRVARLFNLKSRDEVKDKTYKQFSELTGWDQGQCESFQRDDLWVMAHDKPMIDIEEPPLPDPDGKLIYYLNSRVPLHDKAGNVVGVAGLGINITDRKHAEALAREKEATEKANEFLRTAAGSLAHELKNPLAGISITLLALESLAQQQYWRDQETLPPEKKSLGLGMKNHIEIIQQRLAYTNDFISIQLANMGSDNIDTSGFKACSISTCVQSALTSYSYDNSDYKKSVHWQGGKNFNFHGDEHLTKHVLWNLLSNALHFIKEERKGEITIWLQSDADNNYLHFKDTAKGMSTEMASKIFSPFFSKRRGGTGLGLSLCQMVMASYEGDITCRAEEGKYAQFTLRFPRKK
ncbi:MAG: PAS domain-containing sensor histidine kinase, partial [Gammaproteobacteria bacterium]